MSNNKTICLTSSQVRAYKSCRRLYELQYIDCLKPIEEYEPYAVGRNYHSKISQIVKTGEFKKTHDKTDAMAQAFKNFILPKIECNKTETEFKTRLSQGIYLKGKVDGISKENIIIEHKTAYGAVGEDFEDKLKIDDQIMIYMIGIGAYELIYTVCQKPTIKLRQNESADEYLKRCYEWYDESKTSIYKIYKSDKELAEKRAELIRIAKEIRRGTYWHRNPYNCKVLSCVYDKICENYNPEYMAGFAKKEKVNEELSI